MADLNASLISQVPWLSHWVMQVFVVILFSLLLNFFLQRLIIRLIGRVVRTRTWWDDALIQAMGRPLTVLIWVVGLSFAADIVRVETEAAIFNAVGPIREVGVVAALTWFLIRFIREAEKHIIEHQQELEQGKDPTTIHALAKLLSLAVIITASLVMLQTLGFSISGVLAFGGIGGIAVGFAAKDLLANFFGGLMIYLDRPFNVGDWVRSPDRNIEGTVEEIGWRLTRIRTFDKRPLYVPNSVFNTIALENPSRMTNRRIYETIGIRYDDAGKMDAIVRDVKAMLRAHEEIDQDQTMIVNFNAFAASSLDFFVYTFTKTTNWIHYHEVKHDVLMRIERIIAAHGAEIAFPTSTIHMAQDQVVQPEPGPDPDRAAVAAAVSREPA